jgi:hypothetical protein
MSEPQVAIRLERIQELYKHARFAIPEPTKEEIKRELADKRYNFIIRELQLKGHSLAEIYPWHKTIQEMVEND